MSLTKCRECGHTVSTKAPACPGCGIRVSPSSDREVIGGFRTVGGFLGAAVGLGIAVAVLNGGGKERLHLDGGSRPIEVDTGSFQGGTPGEWVTELERRCANVADQMGPEVDRAVFLEQCVEGGKEALRRDGRIP